MVRAGPGGDRPAPTMASRGGSSEVVVEDGEVRATGVAGSRADRVAAEESKDAEATANRQRLLFDNLANLSRAADQADRDGNPEYAAALRLRAEVLAKSVRME